MSSRPPKRVKTQPDESGKQPPDKSGKQQLHKSGKQQPGKSRKQQPGKSGKQQPGESGKQQPGKSGKQHPGKSGKQQPGKSGKRQPGKSAKQQPDKSGNQQPGKSGKQQPGKSGNRQPGKSGKQQPGKSGKQQPGKSGKQQPGKSGKQQPGKSGKQQPGKSEKQQPGKSGKQQSEKSGIQESDTSRTEKLGTDDKQEPHIQIEGKFFPSGINYAIRQINKRGSTSWRGVTILGYRFNDETNEDEYFVHYHNGHQGGGFWAPREKLKMCSYRDTNQSEAPVEEPEPNSRQQAKIKGVKRKQAQSVDKKTATKIPPILKIVFVNEIILDGIKLAPWFNSPFNVPTTTKQIEKLWMCSKCFSCYVSHAAYADHMISCDLPEPAGKRIYRNCEICVYEVNGFIERKLCENVCLLFKCFLEHKVIPVDVTQFWFYLAYTLDEASGVPYLCGYFSKAKSRDFNLSCISVLPPCQGMGIGTFLISLSYELSRIENRFCDGPEHPLSESGEKAYMNYWNWIVWKTLSNMPVPGLRPTVEILSQITCVSKVDITNTLRRMGLRIKNTEYELEFDVSPQVLEDFKNKFKLPMTPILLADPKFVDYTPEVAVLVTNLYQY